jgi:hypothetical protein
VLFRASAACYGVDVWLWLATFAASHCRRMDRHEFPGRSDEAESLKFLANRNSLDYGQNPTVASVDCAAQ